MKLALYWNRIDIAKSDIFTGEEIFDSTQLSKLLEIALIDDKPEFVKLLLENGTSLESFLTYGRLYYLYNAKSVRINLLRFFFRIPSSCSSFCFRLYLKLSVRLYMKYTSKYIIAIKSIYSLPLKK